MKAPGFRLLLASLLSVLALAGVVGNGAGGVSGTRPASTGAASGPGRLRAAPHASANDFLDSGTSWPKLTARGAGSFRGHAPPHDRSIPPPCLPHALAAFSTNVPERPLAPVLAPDGTSSSSSTGIPPPAA